MKPPMLRSIIGCIFDTVWENDYFKKNIEIYVLVKILLKSNFIAKCNQRKSDINV